MRKLLVILFALLLAVPAFSQIATPKKKKINLGGRSADHFMLQFSIDSWSGAADSVSSRIKGFSKGFNSYIMYDLPFKSDQRFSVGLGIGISTSSMGFKNTYVDIASKNAQLPFTAVDSLDHYKKFKLATSYLEIPLELRFTGNPERPGKTFKIAIGAKVGTMLNAHTKGKTLLDGTGATIRSSVDKISTKNYFNSTRLAGTARIGYGYFSLFASYNFTTIFKDAVAPNTKLLQLGITLSGL
ncbi:MAG: outer membrane beta-barrel protein [Ferruginibacter sp.]